MLTTVLDRVASASDQILVSDAAGEYTGEVLLRSAAALSTSLAREHNGVDGLRLALLAQPGLAYVSGMLAAWMSNAMVVPLCPEHPRAEMAHVLTDADVHGVLVDPRLSHLLPESDLPVVVLPTAHRDVAPPTDAGDSDAIVATRTAPDAPALMLYTSGTTGKPKGVVHTHATMNAQISCLVEAWEWNETDRIAHFLPLHHVHGLVNKLLCPLWVGARCDMFERFDAALVLERMSDAAATESPFTIFMAVPTVYAKAIAAWEAAPEATQQRWSHACRALRVMISGSAALPVPVLERWREISGQTLLERYGMTEIGIALGNPLHGERRPGFVGQPLPGM
ncbi:MAG: AMP-binding protein, partial [Ilumatobacteraceae bacterium]